MSIPTTRALANEHNPVLMDIVRRAGDEILQVYNTDFAVQTKQDESPLTQADLAAHAVIADGLNKLSPDIPILSEESALPDFDERSQWPRYWLVDPLDGTMASLMNHAMPVLLRCIGAQSSTTRNCCGSGATRGLQANRRLSLR